MAKVSKDPRRVAVLLRGVNVGGVKVPMAQLRTTLTDAGFVDVVTLLASGNVVLTVEGALSNDAVKDRVEKAMHAEFGYPTWVVVHEASAFDEVIAATPYPADDDGVHSYLTFATDPAALGELASAADELATTQAPAEYVLIEPYALAWPAAKGSSLVGSIAKASTRKRFKETTTTRNLRTVLKIRDALGD